MQHDQIVSVPDHLRLRVRFSYGCFQSMQGYVRQQRRDDPALRRAGSGGKEFVAFHHACFHPGANRTPHEGEGVQLG
jgi:hypothetical protein